MRPRRAIIFDDEITILKMLERYLSKRDYEVLLFDRPIICPFYGEHTETCKERRPCTDIIITDINMPEMSGIELLTCQMKKGCPQDIKNKAIISGDIDDYSMEKINRLGCAFFRKPFSFSDIGIWLDEREKYIDLTKPLPTIRTEPRLPSLIYITYNIKPYSNSFIGMVINHSKSGLCIKLNTRLLQDQVIMINTPLPNSCQTASLRWIRKTDDHMYIAGFYRC